MSGPGPADVDEYIARAPASARPALEQLRQVIRAAAPGAAERISYGMPAYHQGGRVAYFSAHARHVGLYPFIGAEAASVGLDGFISGKATLRFPIDQPLPVAQVRRLIEQRVRANEGQDRLG